MDEEWENARYKKLRHRIKNNYRKWIFKRRLRKVKAKWLK